MSHRHYHHGYIALITVIIVSAIAVAVTTTLLTLGLGFSRSVYTGYQSTKALYYAEGCAADALEQLHADPTFVGSGENTLTDGTCTYEIVGDGQMHKNIHTSGSVGNTIRRIDIEITQIIPVITIGSWRDVAN